jgi:hypothetical protein
MKINIPSRANVPSKPGSPKVAPQVVPQVTKNGVTLPSKPGGPSQGTPGSQQVKPSGLGGVSTRPFTKAAPAPIRIDPPANVPTKGIEFNKAMKMGLKGSEMFGVAPKIDPVEDPDDAFADDFGQGEEEIEEVTEDPDSDEDDAAEDAFSEQDEEDTSERPEFLPDPERVTPQQARAVMAIREKGQVLTTGSEPKTFSTPAEAEAYWEATWKPWDKLTEAQKVARNNAALLLIAHRRQMFDAILGLLNEPGVVPLDGNTTIQITIGSKSGTPNVSGITTQQITQGTGPGPSVPKAGGASQQVAQQAPPVSVGQIDNPMLTPCHNGNCTAPRYQHKEGKGACFKPACGCGHTCQTFMDKDAEPEAFHSDPYPETYVEYDDGQGGIRRVASTKSVGPRESTGLGKIPDQKSGGTGGPVLVQQHSITQGQDNRAESTSNAAQSSEGTVEQVEEQEPVTPQVLERMMNLGGSDDTDKSTYWPFTDPSSLATGEGVEDQRKRIISRVVSYWNRAIHTPMPNGKEGGPLREDLNLASNSYRVILAAVRLCQAIEDYAVTPISDAKALGEREGEVGKAALGYLKAHEPLPANQLDCGWDEYTQYCEAYGLDLGRPLSDIADPAPQ